MVTEVYQLMIRRLVKEKVTDSSSAILFFQGFPDELYPALQKSEVGHFCGEMRNINIDYRNIDAGRLIQHFITSKGVCWGFYEELIALANTLNDFSVGNKGLFIIKNNMFDDFYPITVPID